MRHFPMSVLKSLETKIADLVEGTFGRVFRSEVRPVELARGLVKEMDEHRTVSVARVYVPNEYVVWLSPDDRRRFDGVEREISDELGAYLLEHARREKLALVSRPQVTFDTDDALSLGEFGIQARLVRPSGGSTEQEGAEQADHGHTMVYSTSDRLREELDRPRGPEEWRGSRTRALVIAEGKRMVIPSDGAVLGRSRDCDVILADTNVSRRHAEIRRTGDGWTIRDLGSTNGTTRNGSPVRGTDTLKPGDRLQVGTADVRFVVE